VLTAADNELLARTGAGTGMGEYFRRFWKSPMKKGSEQFSENNFDKPTARSG
jgi:hypothetical protein